MKRMFVDSTNDCSATRGRANIPHTLEPKHVAVAAIVRTCADARTWRGRALAAACQTDPPAKSSSSQGLEEGAPSLLKPSAWTHGMYAQCAGDPPPPQSRAVTSARKSAAETAKETLRLQLLRGSCFNACASPERAKAHHLRTQSDITRFAEAAFIRNEADRSGVATCPEAAAAVANFEAAVEETCWLPRRSLDHACTEGTEGNGTWTRRAGSAGFDPTAPLHTKPAKTPMPKPPVVDGVWTTSTCPACAQTFPEPGICSTHFWSCYDSLHESAKRNPIFAVRRPSLHCKQDGKLGERVRLLHQALLNAGQENVAECFLELVAECGGDPKKVMALSARTRKHAKH
jgi:hypothetical protein